MEAVKDEHGRVRLEGIVAASWLEKKKGQAILEEAAKMPMDEWMKGPYETAVAHLNKVSVKEHRELAEITNRSEEHTSELQSRGHLVCRLLLEKKKPQGQQNARPA